MEFIHEYNAEGGHRLHIKTSQFDFPGSWASYQTSAKVTIIDGDGAQRTFAAESGYDESNPVVYEIKAVTEVITVVDQNGVETWKGYCSDRVQS